MRQLKMRQTHCPRAHRKQEARSNPIRGCARTHLRGARARAEEVAARDAAEARATPWEPPARAHRCACAWRPGAGGCPHADAHHLR